jgi:hypothetical protein
VIYGKLTAPLEQGTNPIKKYLTGR